MSTHQWINWNLGDFPCHKLCKDKYSLKYLEDITLKCSNVCVHMFVRLEVKRTVLQLHMLQFQFFQFQSQPISKLELVRIGIVACLTTASPSSFFSRKRQNHIFRWRTWI